MKFENQKLTTFLIIILLTFGINIELSAQNLNTQNLKSQKPYFVKNIGQLKSFENKDNLDRYYLQDPKTILYYVKIHKYEIYIKKSGFVVSYFTPTEKVDIDNSNEIEIQTKIKGHNYQAHSIEYKFSCTNFTKVKLTDYIAEDIRLWDSVKYAPISVLEFKNEYFENIYNSENGKLKEFKNIPTFNSIIIPNIYDNIDLRYYFTDNGEFEYDFIVKPQGNPKNIQFSILHTRDNYLDDNGELIADTELGDFISSKPISFNINDDELKYLLDRGELNYENYYKDEKSDNSNFINSQFERLVNEDTNYYNYRVDGKIVKQSPDLTYYRFQIGDYDKSKTLIIDPITNLNSTYYGGSKDDRIYSITSDENGNYYAVGYTLSDNSIAFNGYQNSYKLFEDIFLVKFNSKFERVWATYINGSGYDIAYSVKAKGDIIAVSGETSSSDIAVLNSHQSAIGGFVDGYVAKFNGNGELGFATYYGGSEEDKFNAVEIDANNAIIAGGFTQSTTNIFADGYQDKNAGKSDGMLVRFTQTGVRLWGSFFGGKENDFINGLHIDEGNNINIIGSTQSTDLPKLNQIQDTLAGGYDLFFGRFSSSGNLLRSSYYGGSGNDFGNSIISKTENGKYINYFAGSTLSNSNIATSNTHKSTKNDAYLDGFLVEINGDGQRVKSTYFGGGDNEFGQSLAVKDNNEVILVGATRSTDGINFGGFQSQIAGNTDAYFALFDKDFKVINSSYFGGKFVDEARSVTYNKNFGLFQIAGLTASDSIVKNGFQTKLGGSYDGFILTIGDYNITINSNFDTYCFADKIVVNYSSLGKFNNDNLFDIQLSDSTGSFLSPYSLRKLANSQNNSLELNLPNNLKLSGNYKLRVVSSSPLVVGAESENFTIIPKLNPNTDIQKINSTCHNSNSKFIAKKYPNTKYKWILPNSEIIKGIDSNEVDFRFLIAGINNIQLIVNYLPTNCFDTINFTQNVNQIPSFTFNDITPNSIKKDTLCVNSIGKFKADSIANVKYTWEVFANGTIVNAKFNECEVLWNKTGYYQLAVRATDTITGCSKVVIKYIYVEELPTGNITGLNKTCVDCEQTYKFQSTNSNNSNKLKYDWIIDPKIADILQINKDEITIKPQKEGNIQIKLNVLDSFTNCINTFAFNISISQEVPLTISGNENICEKEVYTYYTIDRDYFDFTWKIDGNYDLINSTKSSRTIKWNEEQTGKVTLIRKDKNLNKEEIIELNVKVDEFPYTRFIDFIKEKCIDDTVYYRTNLNDLDLYKFEYNIIPLDNQKDFFIIYVPFQELISFKVNKSGKYLITLNITTKNSCSLFLSDTLTILPLPEKPSVTNINNVLTSNSTATKYFWYKDNVLLLESNSPEFTANKAGTYYVITENEFGCKSEKSNEIVVKITSVENEDNYGNQLENEYKITEITENFILINSENITNTESFTIQLSDVLGRILPISTIYENGNIQIKLTENNRFIANNQYFLNIKGNNTNTTLKFSVD